MGRTRIATALGLPPPGPPVRPSEPPPRQPRAPGSADDRADALIALRVLAAAGPQTLDTLIGAVGRARRSRSPSAARLATTLNAHGAVVDDRHRWQAPANQWTSPPATGQAAAVNSAHRDATAVDVGLPDHPCTGANIGGAASQTLTTMVDDIDGSTDHRGLCPGLP